MVNHTWLEACTIWWSGKSLAADSIYGFSVLWIARTGKLLQFIGAIMVISEIIGKERLKKFGHDLTGLSQSLIKISKAWDWFIDQFSIPDINTPKGIEARREKQVTFADIKNDPLSYINVLVAVVVTIIAWSASPFSSIWTKWLVHERPVALDFDRG